MYPVRALRVSRAVEPSGVVPHFGLPVGRVVPDAVAERSSHRDVTVLAFFKRRLREKIGFPGCFLALWNWRIIVVSGMRGFSRPMRLSVRHISYCETVTYLTFSFPVRM